jgi:DNA-directed RNA polymerase subunit RPC12/RpoP
MKIEEAIKSFEKNVEMYKRRIEDYNDPDVELRAALPIQKQLLERSQLALSALRAQRERENPKTCEYEIDEPSKEGYSSDPGRFYECTNCKADYINIDQAGEWTHCPYCGAEITSKDTLLCRECACAEWDGEGYYCENKKGKYYGENVSDSDFNGCAEYNEPKEATK